VLEGHIKNSQTRALQAILQASGIPFKFVEVENPSATTALPIV
jgi:glutathione S-transferase